MERIRDIMSALFEPIWNMIADNGSQIFGVSFLVLYLTIFLIMALCTFVCRAINIGVSSDLSYVATRARSRKNGGDTRFVGRETKNGNYMIFKRK